MSTKQQEPETQSAAISRQFRQTAGLPERKSDAPADALADPPELAPVELEDSENSGPKHKAPAKKTAAKKTVAKKTAAKKTAAKKA